MVKEPIFQKKIEPSLFEKGIRSINKSVDLKKLKRSLSTNREKKGIIVVE